MVLWRRTEDDVEVAIIAVFLVPLIGGIGDI